MKEKIVIITDLDGSLLHPRTYSFRDALPALQLIKERDIPLILSSSKTRAEIELYRKRLDNNDPFVSENGGGVFIPEGYFPFIVEGVLRDGFKVVAIGSPYDKVRKVLLKIKEQLHDNIKGFGDMTVSEVAELTGMTVKESSLSKMREFDEPFVFDGSDSDKKELLKSIEEEGFHWTEGRFLHILGNHDKGKAAKLLFEYYEKVFGDIITMGIGDSLNDLPLLEEVDYPVLIPKEDGSYVPGINLERLIKAPKVGPEGWGETVTEILKDML
jgi:mannosyl-3-phosphoglycerate phosphatase family protein